MSKLKVVFMGMDIQANEQGEGKTSLIMRYLGEPNYSSPGMASYDNEDLNYTIWDLSVKGDLKWLKEVYVSEAAILVYCIDTTKALNIEEIRQHIAKMQQKAPKASVLLVGTKCDLSEPQFTLQDLKTFALQEGYNAKAFFTSANENKGVIELFQEIKEIFNKRAQEVLQIEAKQRQEALFNQALFKLKQVIAVLPEKQQKAIEEASDKLVNTLNDSALPHKHQAIQCFQEESHAQLKNIPMSMKKRVLKSLSAVAVSATVAVITAVMLGVALGGLWIGPAAFIGAVVMGDIAASAVMGSSIALGLSAGALTACSSLFNPKSKSLEKVQVALDQVVQQAKLLG